MTSIPLRQAQLIKRTAWRNMQRPQVPTEQQKQVVKNATDMLVSIGCLGYAVCDLEDELAAAGMLRQGVKYTISRVQKIIRDCHGTTYQALRSIAEATSRSYNDIVESEWAAIDDAVLLSPPERSYNIVVALCRRIVQLNGQIAGKYFFTPAGDIGAIPRLLEGIVVDRNIDRIIEIAVRQSDNDTNIET